MNTKEQTEILVVFSAKQSYNLVLNSRINHAYRRIITNLFQQLSARVCENVFESSKEGNSLNEQPLVVYVHMTFALSRERPCKIYECSRYKITLGLQTASRD